MTPAQIAELKAKAEAATPGEWTQDGSGVVADFNGEMLYVSQSFGDNAEEDIEFIAAANPQTVLKLIDRIEKAEALLRFYAEGGHPAKDMWQHKELGFFTGRRAREYFAKLDFKREEAADGE